MRYATLSLVVVAVLVVVFACSFSPITPVSAQGLKSQPQSGTELISFSLPAENGSHHVVLIDPKTRVMSVYGVDASSGELSLRSVRNIHWDLQIEDFNGGTPSPKDIRSMIGLR